MTDRRARVLMVGLILVFPWLMTGLGPASWSGSGVATVAVVEALLVVGLLFAAGERERLLALRSRASVGVVAAERRVAPSVPHVRPAGQAGLGQGVGRRLRASIGLSPR